MIALLPHVSRLAISVVVVLLPSAALASEQIAVKAGCAVCHAATKKVLGPSYRDIAIKYKNRTDALTLLSGRVRHGGKDVWGPVPMPPTDASKVNDADLKAVLTWILKTPN
jgi:cytochrome c